MVRREASLEMGMIGNGTVSALIDASGAITFAEQAVAPNYGLVDEIASRVLATAGRVLGVRKADIPRGAALAAILRYPA